MRPDIPKDEIEKLRESQDPEGSKKKTIEKSERMTKASTFDLTKADSTSTGILDILDNPDVAVWSKGIMKKTIRLLTKSKNPITLSQRPLILNTEKGRKNKVICSRQWIQPTRKMSPKR